MSTTRQLPRGRERKTMWKGNVMVELRPEDLNASKPDCLSGTALEQKAESVGLAKTQMEIGRTIVLALMAGMLIGSGALFMTCVKADPTLGFAASNILGGFCFSLGLICVIVAGAELFTGNCLMVMGAASKRFAWAKVLKNWVVVWLGNFAGSLVLVGIVFGCSIMAIKAGDNTIGAQMVTVASGKIGLDPAQIIFRGIMCNFLVCLAVWMGFAGRTVIDKIFTTIFPVMAFVAMGFEHCVANMFFLPMGALLASCGIAPAGIDPASVNMLGALYNWSATVPGNIVGGALMVGMMYWFIYRKKKN
jgi:formate transporter